uniref:Beta-defensin-like domain-containing protein n=1 Tax=Pseudonaja textilis TaxID=8673 RepID=A0A670ZJW2_PSETE
SAYCFLVLSVFDSSKNIGTGRCRRLKGVCRHTLCHPVEVYVGRCNNGMGNCCVDDAEDIRKYKQ